MKPMFSVALSVALALPAIASERQTVDLPPEVTDGFYVTLEECRENARAVYRAFAGPDGGPVSRDAFVSAELPPDIVPNKRDGRLLEDLFEVLDADGNGRLTWEEFDRQINKDLEFADENGDGRLTLRELSKARENLGLGEAIGMIF